MSTPAFSRAPLPGLERPVRVLVVDDSALVREIFSRGLARDPEIAVVGAARDAFEAGDLIPRLTPDVLTLDIEMPRMNGIEFLRRLMPQYPLPVIMVSALTNQGGRMTLDALALGAVDFVTKPQGDLPGGLETLLAELAAKIKAAAMANLPSALRKGRTSIVSRSPLETMAGGIAGAPSRRLVALCASTGGSEAVRAVLRRFPVDMPGVVIVQHMPPGFTRIFAERLDSQCRIEVREAVDGDQVRDGHALVAPGGLQMRVFRDPSDGGWRVRVRREETPGGGHQPSADALFDSVASEVGDKAVGVVLTGMGSDGARALRRMRDAGARCFAQDQESSVVFGMPSEAFRQGGAERLVPLHEIGRVVMEALKR